jgi:hypothetical protein
MHNIWQGLNHDSIIDAVEKQLDKKLSNLLLRRNSKNKIPVYPGAATPNEVYRA